MRTLTSTRERSLEHLLEAAFSRGAEAVLVLALHGLLCCVAQAQKPVISWVNQAGGGDEDFGWGIAIDSGTNVYATGHFTAPAAFGSTNIDRAARQEVFVARYSTNGAFLCVRQAGGPTNDDARGIVADPHGNVYVTGNFTGPGTFSPFVLGGFGGPDVFVAKYDRNGNVLWVQQAGGAGDDEGQSIALDGAGNVLVTGYFSGTAVFGSTHLVSRGSRDIFLACYDSAGALLWAGSAGGSNADEGLGVAADASGNSYLTGYFSTPASFGTNRVTGSGPQDIFVAKYDDAGNLLWIKPAGGAIGDVGHSVAVDSASSVCVTGSFNGMARFEDVTLQSNGSAADIFVAKYDPTGHLLWVRREGGDGPDNGNGVGVDANDSIYVAGQFLGTIVLGTNVFNSPSHADVFVANYDPAGTLRWAVRAGGTAYKAAYAIAVDPQGPAFIAGFFRGATTFGDFNLLGHPQSSNRDVFVSRVDGPPSPPPTPRLGITVAGNQVILSWPANATGFRPEAVTNLVKNSFWSTITNVPSRSAGKNFITNAISGSTRFYRLRIP